MSTNMDVEPNRTRLIKSRRIKGRSATWWIVALALGLATVAWSQEQTSFGGFFADGGPWRAVSNVPECSNQGRVCAEWPFQNDGQMYLAVCCVQPSDLGSMEPPQSACAAGGMLVIRRGGNAGLSW